MTLSTISDGFVSVVSFNDYVVHSNHHLSVLDLLSELWYHETSGSAGVCRQGDSPATEAQLLLWEGVVEDAVELPMFLIFVSRSLWLFFISSAQLDTASYINLLLGHSMYCPRKFRKAVIADLSILLATSYDQFKV